MIDIEKSHINVRRNTSFDEIAKEKLSTKAYYKKHFLDILREQENAPREVGMHPTPLFFEQNAPRGV